MRTPVASKIALAIAAATGRIDGSPEPVGGRHACKLGLEGIVSKRKDSAYRSGRSPDWLKMKNANAPAE
jgi:hypothetical protein